MDRSYSTVSGNGNNGLFKLYNPGILRHFFSIKKNKQLFWSSSFGIRVDLPHPRPFFVTVSASSRLFVVF